MRMDYGPFSALKTLPCPPLPATLSVCGITQTGFANIWSVWVQHAIKDWRVIDMANFILWSTSCYSG